MALLSVAERSHRVLAHAAPLPAETRAARARRCGRVLADDLDGAAHAAAGRRFRHGRLCRARRRCRARAGDASTVIGEVAGRPSVRRHGRPRRGRAHLHRRRDAARRRHRGDPGDHDARRRHGHRSTSRSARAAISARQGLDFAAGEVLLAKGRRLTARDLALAAAMNHPLCRCTAGPRVARARDRRRIGGARARARARARSSLPTASRSRRMRAARRRRGHRSRHRAATGSTPRRGGAPRARARRRHSRDQRRRLGRRLRFGAAGLRRRGHGRCRSGRSRCGPAGR